MAPGEFYGPRGAQHVRMALTATDERIGGRATAYGIADLAHAGGPRTDRFVLEGEILFELEGDQPYPMKA